MKKVRTYILSIAALSIMASCSMNRDLVQLEEYDDLYYTPSEKGNEATAYNADQFSGANSAESSYYGESPYVNESEKPSADFDDKSNGDQIDSDDYYDPDYATRIENFHRNDEANYIYGDAFANNMNPRFSGSMHMNSFNGFNSFGFGVGIGMGMGNPWMGNRWCDPFWDPFCYRSPWGRPGFGMSMGWGGTWGMYDPFSPWYNPYMAYNPYGWGSPYGWGNPYMNNPYGYNPYYGPGVIIVDGGGSSRGFQNTSRNSSSSGRTSRGGTVGTTSERRSVGTQSVDGTKTNGNTTTRERSTTNDVTRTRPARTTGNADYYNRSTSRQYAQPDRTRSTPRQSTNAPGYDRTNRTSQNPVATPYTRERQRQASPRQTPDYSRYNRSNSGNRSGRSTYSAPTRSRNSSPSMSAPSRSSSPSTSPSRTSPSRSTGGGSRRR